MSAFHNSKSAERLALGWHSLGIMASLFYSATAVIAMNSIEEFTKAPPPYGTIFRYQYMFAGVNVLVAISGAVWHSWAVVQHRKHLKKLK